MDQIQAHWFDNDSLRVIQDKMLSIKAKAKSLNSDGILRIASWVYVSRVGRWVRLILEEAYCSRFSIHLSVTMMYRDLKKNY